MKGVRGSELRSRLGIALAIIGFTSLLSAAAVFHGSFYSSSRGRQDVRFVAAHVAEMRAELARVHTGKVDKETLQRILDMNAQSAYRDAPVGDSPDAPAVEEAIAHYLAGHSAADRTLIREANFVSDAAGAESASAPAAVSAPVRPPPQPPEDENDRTYVGQKTCEGCHAQEAANWAHTIHAAVFTLNPRDSVEAQGCEACHGPGSAHVKNPSDLSTIISFSHKSRTPVARQNAQCLTCHQGGQRIFWHGSIHENNNLACSDCHNPMSNFAAHGLTAREAINQTCFA